MIKVVTFIINLRFQRGSILKQWKCPLINSIFKKGAKLDFTYYRPLSLLPIFSKVLRKAVKKLLKYLYKTIFFSYQEFFVNQESIWALVWFWVHNYALLHLLKNITHNINIGNTTGGLFFLILQMPLTVWTIKISK